MARTLSLQLVTANHILFAVKKKQKKITKQNTCLTMSVRFTEEGILLWYFGLENRTVFAGRIKVILISFLFFLIDC